MNTRADVAMESAGITLMRGDLVGLVRARKRAVATLRNVRQNLFCAFVDNAAGARGNVPQARAQPRPSATALATMKDPARGLLHRLLGHDLMRMVTSTLDDPRKIPQ